MPVSDRWWIRLTGMSAILLASQNEFINVKRTAGFDAAQKIIRAGAGDSVLEKVQSFTSAIEQRGKSDVQGLQSPKRSDRTQLFKGIYCVPGYCSNTNAGCL